MWLFLFVALLAQESFAIGGDSGAHTLSEQYDNGDTYMGIRLRGAVQIPVKRVDGFRLVELSGLAWDESAGLLYSVSDQGVLFHLKPTWIEGNLSKIEVLRAYPLLDAKDKPLASRDKDAEGLSLYPYQGKQYLAVSFERQPRIALYSPTGVYQKALPLAPILQQRKNYRSRNKMLEALLWHPQHGFVSGAERPLRGQNRHQLFNDKGHYWNFPPYAAKNSAVVGLEGISGSADLLVLERAYVAPWKPLIISLRRVQHCFPSQQQSCAVSTIAVFDSSKNWRLDNFEGLSLHQGRHYFMVSDDNNSLLQQTLLVYFELL